MIIIKKGALYQCSLKHKNPKQSPFQSITRITRTYGNALPSWTFFDTKANGLLKNKYLIACFCFWKQLYTYVICMCRFNIARAHTHRWVCIASKLTPAFAPEYLQRIVTLFLGTLAYVMPSYLLFDVHCYLFVPLNCILHINNTAHTIFIV